MFSSNLIFSGLSLGVIGSILAPIIHSYSSVAGGGSKVTETVVPSNTQLTSQDSQEKPEENTPKKDISVKLLLAGTKSEGGIIAELTREDKEGSQWKVGKVTWQGESWKRSWTLYSDDEDGEYTFTDKSPYELRSACYARARYWKNHKVCVTRGRVVQNNKDKWKKDFPKIKLTDWKTRFKGRGYGRSVFLDSLSNCSVEITESKAGENKWTVTISCDEGWLDKTLDGSDFSTMTVEES